MADKVINVKETSTNLNVSRATLYAWTNPKSKWYRPDFPKKVKIGIRSVGFLESEIDAFIAKSAGNRA